ncbi:ABC transporter ATP-binding protein [bacterium]|nr:ABC transporter ATP-binding protein [bacterium]
MEKLKREKKTTIVMVSHDINLASMYGDRLLLLKQGKVLTIGTPNDVIRYSTLENAYGCVLMVDENPLGNVPRVMPVPQRFLDQSNTKHWKKEEEC